MATFLATQDASMDYKMPDTNFGSFTTLDCLAFYILDVKSILRRVILDFDITAVAGETLTSAYARLHVFAVHAASAACTVYRCTRPASWVESEVTWTDYKDSTAWTAGGGDLEVANGEAVTPVSFVGPTATGWFDVTGLLEFATDAVANRSNIVSMIMKLDAEDPGSNDGFQFSSKETSGSKSHLVVTYDGEPAAARRIFVF